MISTGIDIVYIPRFKKKSEQPLFLERLFTDQELKATIESLAGKFAAKEAIKKANSTLIEAWKDVEILNTKNGKPIAKLRCSKKKITISISHEKDYAIAIALIDTND